ncbi:MAG: DUF1553 domain-containing protein [Verrucomicrobia bacterium]|nr:DUF1553 domain-containing protein [Verrucomicrobiota bacterium]
MLILAGASNLRSAAPTLGDASKLPPPSSKAVDFVKDIRPIFEASCYKCHGPEKQKSEFRLDVKAAALKGGEHGQDIVFGKSAESPLIHFVAGLVEDMQMPQKGERLTAEQIGLLRAWIDQGAKWPEGIDAKTVKSKSDYWVFQPASRPAIPKVQNKRWARNPIDFFVLARLEKEKLKPSPEADRRTLIRRLSFDLTGLPPTPEEVAAFIADRRSDGYERLVDRLLASARYGERWGRHWLDVVHYGESHGYDKDKPRLNAWPYRDYVIQSFNDDTPYSRFVQEQLAGDVLFPNHPEKIPALGFISAGPWDFVGHVELPITKTDGLIARYNDRDDMVMTTMSTFQSLTVHCARCHDHKFDPIRQEDYYSLQAVFAGVDRANRQFDMDKEIYAKRKTLNAEKKSLEAKLKSLNEAVAKLTSPELEKLDARLKEQKDKLAALPKPTKTSHSNGYHSGIESSPDVEKWVQVDLGKSLPLDEVRLHPARPTDFADTPGFGFPVRFRLDISDEANFSKRTTLEDHTAADFTNPLAKPVVISATNRTARFVRVTATKLWERTKDYVFALSELQIFSGGTNVALGANVTALDSIESGRWAKAYLVDDCNSRNRLGEVNESEDQKARRQEAEDAVKQSEEQRKALVESLLDEPTRNQLRETNDRLTEVKSQLAALPTPKIVYAAANDFSAEGSFHPAGNPRPVNLLSRGDVKRPGKLMSPGALSCLPGLDSHLDIADPDDEGSRRAALAKWITDPKNLLTRRSIVNRVWQYHFGRGLIDTPNDFGHMGALPTHPELLDWLACWFLDNGESLKQLHKLLVTSSTYRQSSSNNPQSAHLDGDNRFLWRMNRQRLDAEEVRDSILFVNGKLDPTMGGPSVQQFYFKDDHSPVYDYGRFDVDSAGSYRRSIYRFIVRSVPDPFMDCLDSADPSLLTAKRNTTITALQALALLNDPFVLKQCEHFAERINSMSPDPSKQIEAAYQLALNRSPRPDESKLLIAYAKKFGLPNLCRVIFNSNEFLFVD